MKFGREIMLFKGTSAIHFNPIDSITLQLLRFKVIRRAMYNSGIGLFMNHDNHDNQTFSLLPKNESRLIKSPVLSVCEISDSQGGEYEV
jgi:hypothetical protein